LAALDNSMGLTAALAQTFSANSRTTTNGAHWTQEAEIECTNDQTARTNHDRSSPICLIASV
jgi:hypothetical protein